MRSCGVQTRLEALAMTVDGLKAEVKHSKQEIARLRFSLSQVQMPCCPVHCQPA